MIDKPKGQVPVQSWNRCFLAKMTIIYLINRIHSWLTFPQDLKSRLVNTLLVVVEYINKKFLTCQLLTEIFCQVLTEFEIFCQDLTEFEIFCQGLTDIFCQGLTEFFGLFMWSADRFFSVKCWQIFFFKQQSLLTDFWASWQILDSLDRNFLSRGVQLTPLFDLKYQLGV